MAATCRISKAHQRTSASDASPPCNWAAARATLVCQQLLTTLCSPKRNRGPHRRRPVPPGTEGRVPGKDEWLLCGPFSAQSTGNHAGDRRPKPAFSEAPWTMEKERQHRLLGERGSMWYSRTPTN